MGAACIAAAFVMLTPVETFAGLKGYGGRMAAPPLVSAPAPRALGLKAATPFRGLPVSVPHHRHFGHSRAIGVGWPLGWYGSGWYGTSYSPSNYVMIHDRPLHVNVTSPAAAPAPAPAPPPVIYVIKYRPGCETETKTVAWSDGKDRAITMVRC
jgi:hypothetical protein